MALVIAGCGDDDGGTSENVGEGPGQTTSSTGHAGAFEGCKTEGTATGTAAEEVVLTLGEWTIKPSAQPKAGVISFKAENAGAEEHEVVFVKADNAESLPKDADGALDEEKLPEGALIGEIEAFPPGQVCSGAFNLAAGKYVMVCNVVHTEPNGEKEAHFAEGMHAPLTVS
ncbi:MAG: hypothetical protein AB1679_27150 [Actinomycetota bacterium]|jgi:hypothetical protein